MNELLPSWYVLPINLYQIMVKRSLFWGQASGKLGEAVYYRAGGEQRTRTYLKNIKNPKTQAQAIQRARLNNLTACFRGASIFLRSFFRAPKANQSAFNAFVAANSQNNMYVANDVMIKIQEAIPLGLLFANGDSGDNLEMSATQVRSLSEPEVGGKWMMAMPLYIPALPYEEANASRPTGGLMVPDGATLYKIFTAPENGFTLPAEFDLTFLMAEGGSEGMVFITATVHCSATSTDKLHIVQKSQNVGITDADIQKRIVVTDVTLNNPTNDTTVAGMGHLAFGSNYVAENEVYNSVGVVLSYVGANGKTWNQVYMPAAQLLTETYGPYTYDGEIGKQIVAGYTAVQNTI